MSEERPSVQTTIIMRNIANPRRTTLVQLQDADELTTEAVTEEARKAGGFEDPEGLPARTANPRRTTLVEHEELENAPVG